MFGQSDPSRTEKATQRHLQKSRKKGNVPLSSELSKVMSLLIGIIALRLLIWLYDAKLRTTFSWFLSDAISIELTKEET